eukprot:6023872-Prymnesium_polylepis.2
MHGERGRRRGSTLRTSRSTDKGCIVGRSTRWAPWTETSASTFAKRCACSHRPPGPAAGMVTTAISGGPPPAANAAFVMPSVMVAMAWALSPLTFGPHESVSLVRSRSKMRRRS